MLLLDDLVRNFHFPIRPWVKAACAACGWLCATSASLDTCWTKGEVMVSVNFSSKSLLPMAAPRSLFSSLVICTPVPLNSLLASSAAASFTINQDLLALGWYPYPGPFLFNWSHQLLTSFNHLSSPVASSVNQTCLVPVGCNSCTSGIMPTAYILIARRSPCVGPSPATYCFLIIVTSRYGMQIVVMRSCFQCAWDVLAVTTFIDDEGSTEVAFCDVKQLLESSCR